MNMDIAIEKAKTASTEEIEQILSLPGFNHPSILLALSKNKNMSTEQLKKVSERVPNRNVARNVSNHPNADGATKVKMINAFYDFVDANQEP
jgi:hypothetical protein